jgi:hypothetical protein
MKTLSLITMVFLPLTAVAVSLKLILCSGLYFKFLIPSLGDFQYGSIRLH